MTAPQAMRPVGPARAQLRLLQTTDLHMHLLPYNYYSDCAAEAFGLAHAAGLISQLRAEVPNAMLFDCGDYLQGNPLGDYLALERGLDRGAPHAAIAAMNALGYDAATLGNHDFNYGLEFLLTALGGAEFPVLAANAAQRLGADGPLSDTLLLPGSAVLDRKLVCDDGVPRDIRIGVLGLTPPQITIWDHKHLSGRIETRDIVETAAAWVPHLRAAGADLVLVLAHTGIGAPDHVPGQEHAALPLSRVAGIDALMLGHSHLVFPADAVPKLPGIDALAGRLHGIPSVMAGAFGSHLGLIDLVLDHSEGRWRVCSATARAAPVFRKNPDNSVTPLTLPHPAVLAAAAADHQATLGYIRRPVGRSAVPMHSYFALLSHDPVGKLVAEAQRWHVAEALAGTEHAALPLLSATAPFKTGGRSGPTHFTDVPAGDVALRGIADFYEYPNTIRAVRVNGAELCEWLERSAGIFNRLVPDAQDQILLDPEFPGYNFDVIDGLEFKIDLAQPSRYGTDGALLAPKARRIRDLRFGGAPLDPGAQFVVATNNYRASGGGRFPGLGPDRVVLEGIEANRDILQRFVARQGTLAPRQRASWRFCPMPGTSALFETGPGAARCLPEIEGLRLEPLGIGGNGFARYRIRF
jgi:2',3'-cyclic-nucleotide 2'-phosphodiesterase/3'-nucleotidase